MSSLHGALKPASFYLRHEKLTDLINVRKFNDNCARQE